MNYSIQAKHFSAIECTDATHDHPHMVFVSKHRKEGNYPCSRDFNTSAWVTCTEPIPRSFRHRLHQQKYRDRAAPSGSFRHAIFIILLLTAITTTQIKSIKLKITYIKTDIQKPPHTSPHHLRTHTTRPSNCITRTAHARPLKLQQGATSLPPATQKHIRLNKPYNNYRQHPPAALTHT